MKKIKVCHVVSALESGGVETVIYNYCSNMDTSCFEFHLLYQRTASEKNIEDFNKLGFKLYEIPEKVKHPFKNYFETKKYLKNNNIDIVHAHMTLVNFIPLLAAKRLGIKTRISHSHNCDVREKSFIKICFEKILKKLTLRFANVLIACGKDAGEFVYEKKDFIILNNAINLQKYKYDNKKGENLRQKYNIPLDYCVFGNIGRFTVQKNQEFLIETFSEVYKNNNKTVLLIIGDGKEGPILKQKVKELNLEKNVIFTGLIKEVYDYYSMMDAFLLPSLWEGLPIVGLEAQVSGLNCIFSNKIDQNVTVIKDKVTYLELDKKIWTNEMLNLSYQNHNNRDVNLNKFEEKGLSIQKEAEKLRNIYLKDTYI